MLPMTTNSSKVDKALQGLSFQRTDNSMFMTIACSNTSFSFIAPHLGALSCATTLGFQKCKIMKNLVSYFLLPVSNLFCSGKSSMFHSSREQQQIAQILSDVDL